MNSPKKDACKPKRFHTRASAPLNFFYFSHAPRRTTRRDFLSRRDTYLCRFTPKPNPPQDKLPPSTSISNSKNIAFKWVKNGDNFMNDSTCTTEHAESQIHAKPICRSASRSTIHASTSGELSKLRSCDSFDNEF